MRLASSAPGTRDCHISTARTTPARAFSTRTAVAADWNEFPARFSSDPFSLVDFPSVPPRKNYKDSPRFGKGRPESPPSSSSEGGRPWRCRSGTRLPTPGGADRRVEGHPGGSRPRADRRIAGFLTAHEPLMERIAWQFGSRPAICWDNDGPVLVATVREEAWRMLAAIGSPTTRYRPRCSGTSCTCGPARRSASGRVRRHHRLGGGTAPAGGGALCGHGSRLPGRARPGPVRRRAGRVPQRADAERRADAIKQGALLSPGGLVENGSSRPTPTTCRRPAVSRRPACSRSCWLVHPRRSGPV